MQMKVLMVKSGSVFQKILLWHYLHLEFGVYDGVAHCSISMGASVLIYETLFCFCGIDAKGIQKT